MEKRSARHLIKRLFAAPACNYLAAAAMLILTDSAMAQQYTDRPFLQDYALKYALPPDAAPTKLQSVRCDRNQVVNILSDKGLLQPWKEQLVNWSFYRPLNDMTILSVGLYRNQLVYLTSEALLSNAWAGKFYVEHGMPGAKCFAMGEDFTFLLAGKEGLSWFDARGKKQELSRMRQQPIQLVFDPARRHFLVLTSEALYTYSPARGTLDKRFSGRGLTSMALIGASGTIVIGTHNGILSLAADSFEVLSPLDHALPWPEITCLREINGQLWCGSTRGAFTRDENGRYNYYASMRWLVDDYVLDISAGPSHSVLILTETGLSRIVIEKMTLADKADFFQQVQRQRHIRYGFTSEGRLQVPGDVATGVHRDSDNDGLWTSMYLAGELFRYAVTKSEDALQNACEAFEAMERLTEIAGLDGFPARTYEIDGYQSSDLDPDLPEDQKIWRLTDDGRWRWKSTTSSDESCGHFFVYALFAEIVPDQEWKDRAIHQIKIEMDHIIENDWYLVTWNGEITRWGRWNPDYVNSFTIHTGDRRLNSTLILAFLQTAYHFTGEEIYREKAYELIEEHGYLENTLRPASVIGYVEGEPLSDSWNHSDDEMYFLTVPALVKYAFTEALRQAYMETVRSHWEIERSEKNPLWNYIYAMVGGKEFDVEESAWWLREFPLDLVAWDVENHHRRDLVRVERNFRRQQYTEVLPRDERPMHLHNNAYRNDGGEGGQREYPPYIYLLPYWAGRYAGAISAPVQNPAP